jgi:hypothetical protein
MGHCVDHFAHSCSWSKAMLVCKGMAPYGAVAPNDIDRIGEHLNARRTDPDAWPPKWCANVVWG